MTVQVDTDLERGFAQLYEIQKRFLNGSLSPRAVRQPLQDIIESKFIESSQRAYGFDRYTDYLLSLDAQLEDLREANSCFWDYHLTDFQFDDVDTASDHVQSVDDLEVLYVEFGSPEQNVEMWWRLIAGIQPDAWRSDELKTNPQHLRLAPNTRQYEPGIHRIRLNLVAYWEPENGRSVTNVREQVARGGKTLAHAEVLAAYAFHDQLLQQMDGKSLPYADLAGFEATYPGSQPWTGVPYLYWDRLRREVGLGLGWSVYVSVYVSHEWAAPVLRES